MCSQWVNKLAIMRDLSLAQGWLPVEVAGAVGAGDRPPEQDIVEETEEEFYRNWVGGDGEFSTPDLGLIKQMLDMVKQREPSDTEEEKENELDSNIEIMKSNPLHEEHKPNGNGNLSITKNHIKEIKAKEKKMRNVAVNSLLQNMKDANKTQPFNHLKQKQLSPILENDPNKTTKVMNSLDSKKSKSPKKNTLKLSLDPSSMFKKKAAVNSTPKLVKEVEPFATPAYQEYIPSSNVKTYYKQLLEQSKMKEMVRETIWSKVEREMKAIDERRQAEALAVRDAAPSPDPLAPVARTNIQMKLDLIWLPKHRHSMEDECKVCAIRNKRMLTNNNPNMKTQDTYEVVETINEYEYYDQPADCLTTVYYPATDCPAVDSPTLGSPTVYYPATDCPAVYNQAADCPAVDSSAVYYPAVDCSAEDCPAVDYPAVDCPAVDCPAVDCPAVDCPAGDCLAVDCPAEDYPAVDYPAVDYQAVDCPAEACPAVDYPAVDCPAVDCPAVDYAAVDCQAEDYPAVDCPAEDYPAVDYPAVDCPVVDCPAVDCLAVDYPVVDCPAEDCPAVDCPAEDCPAVDCPAEDCPAVDCPASVGGAERGEGHEGIHQTLADDDYDDDADAWKEEMMILEQLADHEMLSYQLISGCDWLQATLSQRD